MTRGIIYVMKTAVSGLVKIGKTGLDNFEVRMYQLEHNGYSNVAGLKRVFAIEVDEYDEKESMLDGIFSRSRVPDSELFALDIDLVVQLLSSFEGKQVYPAPTSQPKAQVFQSATMAVQSNRAIVPDGTYYMNRKNKATGKMQKATMNVVGGKFSVPAGTVVTLQEGAGLSTGVKQFRDLYVDDNGVSAEDVGFFSPSPAGQFVTGRSCNGWVEWKTADGEPINIFRQGDD